MAIVELSALGEMEEGKRVLPPGLGPFYCRWREGIRVGLHADRLVAGGDGFSGDGGVHRVVPKF
jgi:hypothetical protein